MNCIPIPGKETFRFCRMGRGSLSGSFLELLKTFQLCSLPTWSKGEGRAKLWRVLAHAVRGQWIFLSLVVKASKKASLMQPWLQNNSRENSWIVHHIPSPFPAISHRHISFPAALPCIAPLRWDVSRSRAQAKLDPFHIIQQCYELFWNKGEPANLQDHNKSDESLVCWEMPVDTCTVWLQDLRQSWHLLLYAFKKKIKWSLSRIDADGVGNMKRAGHLNMIRSWQAPGRPSTMMGYNLRHYRDFGSLVNMVSFLDWKYTTGPWPRRVSWCTSPK